MTQRKMKKIFNKIMGLALCLVLAVSVLANVPISAAEDYEPYTWVRTIKDKTKTYEGKEGKIIANCFVESLKLYGFKSGIKKINKSLKKIAKGFDSSTLYDYAEAAAKESSYTDIYFDYVTADVTYADDNYVCVFMDHEWYAGGVHNTMIRGYVFDLDTGKALSLSKITGKKWNTIKKLLVEKIVASGEFEGMEDQIDTFAANVKESDISYYINNDGNVVLVLPEYTEPFYGGWCREYVLDEYSVSENK